jgi:pentatricopeptide repeat protein
MAQHVRLNSIDQFSTRASSILFEFDAGTGIVLPVLPGFIGTIVVDQARVVAVNFIPSDQTWRYGEYQQRAKQLDEMKAFAAIASRNGRFQVETESASTLADRIRQSKGIDPTMGLYAAYAYAQAGQYDDVYSVFGYMRDDEIELPIPFDVAMLALRFKPTLLTEANVRTAPFTPMLSQGWALLMKGDAMHRPIHEELRPHLLPALFATLDAEGVAIARAKILSGENK